MKYQLPCTEKDLINKIKATTDSMRGPTLKQKYSKKKKELPPTKTPFYYKKYDTHFEIHGHPRVTLESPYIWGQIIPAKTGITLDISYRFNKSDIFLIATYSYACIILFNSTWTYRLAILIFAFWMANDLVVRNQKLKKWIEEIVEEIQAED